MDTTKVLWFSRHEMTPEQKEALGTNVKIEQVNKTVDSAYELQDEISRNDIIAIVAPINLQQQFLKLADGKPVIMAVNDRVLVPQPDGSEDKVTFQFKNWEQLDSIDIVKHDYEPVASKLNKQAVNQSESPEAFINELKNRKKTYTRPEFSEDQIYEISTGLEHGLSVEQVKSYAKSNIDVLNMHEMRIGLEHGMSVNQINDCFDSYMNTQDKNSKHRTTLGYIRQEAEYKELVRDLIKGVPELAIQSVYDGLDKGFDLEQVRLLVDQRFDENQMIQICMGFENELDAEQILLYANPNIDWREMREMRLGFENDLSIEQVSIYNNYAFDWQQMERIRKGFEDGFSAEQIKAYANPKLNSSQMSEARKGFQNGLTIEQVKVYAKPEFDEAQMLQIRIGFEHGLTIGQIAQYAVPKLDSMDMGTTRMCLELGREKTQGKADTPSGDGGPEL